MKPSSTDFETIVNWYYYRVFPLIEPPRGFYKFVGPDGRLLFLGGGVLLEEIRYFLLPFHTMYWDVDFLLLSRFAFHA